MGLASLFVVGFIAGNLNAALDVVNRKIAYSSMVCAVIC